MFGKKTAVIYFSHTGVTKKLVEKFKEYKGKLGDKESFKEYLSLTVFFVENYEKLYLYALCELDLDRSNTKAMENMQEVSFLFQKLSENTSFEESEILSLGEEYVFSITDSYPEFKQFRFSFENLFRKKEHTPSSVEQSIISKFKSSYINKISISILI